MLCIQNNIHQGWCTRVPEQGACFCPTERKEVFKINRNMLLSLNLDTVMDRTNLCTFTDYREKTILTTDAAGIREINALFSTYQR